MSSPRPVRRGYDTVPNVATAGKQLPVQEAFSANTETPRTPELAGVRAKHRMRTKAGEQTVHWGLLGAQIPEPGNGYGMKVCTVESVENTFKAGQIAGLAEYKEAVASQVHASTTREPLGHGWVRGHKLPARTAEPDFVGFGCPTVLDIPTKELISPRGGEPDSEQARANYKISHGTTASGQALTRDYDWPSLVADSANFTFGKKAGENVDNSGRSVRAALGSHGGEVLAVPGVVVGSDSSRRFQEVTGIHLGRCRNLGLGSATDLPDGHAYGMPSGLSEDTSGQLIRGRYSATEQAPDWDLGRCVVPGRQNRFTAKPFGVPSVRRDVVPPLPQRRSLASSVNYGDDATAKSLLSPGRFSGIGIEDEEFLARRGAPELQAIFENCGVPGLQSDVLEAAMAAQVDLDGAGGTRAASVRSVATALWERTPRGGEGDRVLAALAKGADAG